MIDTSAATEGPESRGLEMLVQQINAAKEPEEQEFCSLLLGLTAVVIAEGQRTPRFRRALLKALRDPGDPRPAASVTSRTGRRAPGLVDPFEILVSSGEEGLRSRLQTLTVEQLKDVIAEHGMDRDRLAMKWKDEPRLIQRIVETSVTRANKGDAFRGGGEEPTTR